MLRMAIMKTEEITREARAKIMWGEPHSDVLAYLIDRGLGEKEALRLLDEFRRERAADIRRSGVKKIVVGAFFVAVLAVYLAVSALIGLHDMRLLALAGISAITGLWKIIEGAGLILRPSGESGDLSNMLE